MQNSLFWWCISKISRDFPLFYGFMLWFWRCELIFHGNFKEGILLYAPILSSTFLLLWESASAWEKRRVNDVAKTQKNWNIFSTSREYCILLICLTSWLHFLNKASTNTKERSTWDIWTFFALPIQSCSSGLANTTFANYNSISNYQKANQRPC